MLNRMIFVLSSLDKWVLYTILGALLLIVILLIYLLIGAYKDQKFKEFLDSIDYFNKVSNCLMPLFGNGSLYRSTRVSRQIVSNFSYKQVNYLVKYFGLVINDETVNHLSDLYEVIDNAVEKASEKKMKKRMLNSLPSFELYYISPTGRSRSSYEFLFDSLGILYLAKSIEGILKKQPKYIVERNKLTPIIRDSILARDNFTCCKCGNSVYKEPNLLLEVDHIVPISKGGKTEPNNLQTLCWRCNRSKSDNIEQIEDSSKRRDQQRRYT